MMAQSQVSKLVGKETTNIWKLMVKETTTVMCISRQKRRRSMCGPRIYAHAFLLDGKHSKEIKWRSKFGLNYPINLTRTHHEHLINVLIIWNSSIHHVPDLSKYPRLIYLIWEIECHEAHMIWRWWGGQCKRGSARSPITQLHPVDKTLKLNLLNNTESVNDLIWMRL